MRKAILIVDVQRDFCSGGVLEAHDTESLINPLNKAVYRCVERKIDLFYSRDWHPEDHNSFSRNGGPWPPHCIENSEGAHLHPDLLTNRNSTIIDKGNCRESEGYSAFENGQLYETLSHIGVNSLIICGIALEYCVSKTASDAVELGLSVVLCTDLTRSITDSSEEYSAVLDTLRNLGITMATASELGLN